MADSGKAGASSKKTDEEAAAEGKDAYEGIKDAAFEETIGLLGGRQGGYESGTRASRRKRMGEILAVVRKYDILHGLTPVTLRKMLE